MNMETCFIDIARKVAFNSELVQKHGSILIIDNQFFTGYNHFYNGKNNNVAIHAEEDAINNFIANCRKKYFDDAYIRRRLHRAVLITIRVKKDSIKCSAPCRNCIELIKNYGIKQIIYSERDGEDNTYYIKKKSRDLENRPSSGYRWRERQTLLCS